MLVLGRNPGEYVVINDEVIVKVVRVKGELKLAIDAPKNISIVRGELYEQQHGRPATITIQ